MKQPEKTRLSLLIVSMFTIVTLFVPTNATAEVSCTDPSLEPNSYYVLPDGTKVDGTFYVEAGAGNPSVSTEGYEFIYEICSLTGESLAQANLLIPAETFCEISKPGRIPKSVKIREFEPSTGFSLTDPNTDVITWDSLKLDPSNQESINVYLTRTGAGPSLIELKTASGQQYVEIDGPICCSKTPVPTLAILSSLAFGDDVGGDPYPMFVITYDSCTGEIDAPSEDDFEELEHGAFVCESETELGPGERCSPWARIRQLGPRSGAPLLTEDLVTREKVRLLGFGKRIFRERVAVVRTLTDGPSGPPDRVRRAVTFNGRIRARYGANGDPVEIKRVLETEVVTAEEVSLYVAPAQANGKPDTRRRLLVRAGPRRGALIEANALYFCSRRGIGCYR